ncbi:MULTISPECIES: metal ABC transporter permease [unclassified Bradyrhizobium]|uniref:metal ABC transporter permease n=1 Tax=unclassified Bradyrhizobium TaxID=2631580 RepID=UPI00247A29FE|nr:MULTISPECIES: metal ABC transporter permease [unclassified Bradyrhizobium]WGR72059.1 metal ABC transporter permease [Bradyrhizobium sp. ISRA426]WGR76893.1 metal ABC transporter permease [Bradyrhizobium sp. ISRA430]WGR87298.1 metal ABC transporter permease [Bradyrhizobium sp. ISRA432]
MSRMSSLSAAPLAGAAIIGVVAAAVAAEQPARIRGEIQSLSGNTLNVRSYDGKPLELMLDSQTQYKMVVPAHLSDIKQGDFVGVGATGPEDGLEALEVVIFPASMRGTGEGHYAWSVPAAVANADRHAASTAPGAPAVQGTMTNGTVGRSLSEPAAPVQGTMTNGTVGLSSGKDGSKKLTLSYNDGKQTQISVPSDAPVVRFTPGQRSDLTSGAKVFALASEGNGSTLVAKSIAVGQNGLMPPM